MAVAGESSRPHVDRRAAVEASVLRALADLLAEGRSFQALSVEQIARRAGIGRTAFYFYFRDKRDLLRRLTEDVFALLYEQADRWWHGDVDGLDELGSFVAPTARLYLEHATLLRTVADVAAYDEDVRSFWSALVGRFIDATRERIERDQAAGRAAAVPAAETAAALVWMGERSLYEFSRDRAGEDPAQLIDALRQIFLRTVYGRLPRDG